MLQRKEAIESQTEDVKRRIEAERSLRDSEAASIAAAHAQRRDLEAQRNERSARLEELRSGTKGTKEELIALRDEVVAQQARVAEARIAVEATRGMIIASPEKIKAELVSLETAAEAEQSALDSAELRRRLTGRQLEVIAKADKDVTKAMTLMSEAEVRVFCAPCAQPARSRRSPLHSLPCVPRLPPPPLSQAEAVKLKRIQKDEKTRKSELEGVSTDVDALKSQLEHAQSQRRRIEEKLQEIRQSAEARIAAQAKELEAVWREAAEFGDEIKASVDSRRAAEAEEMRLERRKEALIAQHSAEVADMVGSLKRLSASLGTYNNNIVSGLARIDGPPRQGI